MTVCGLIRTSTGDKRGVNDNNYDDENSVLINSSQDNFAFLRGSKWGLIAQIDKRGKLKKDNNNNNNNNKKHHVTFSALNTMKLFRKLFVVKHGLNWLPFARLNAYNNYNSSPNKGKINILISSLESQLVSTRLPICLDTSMIKF